MKVQQALTGAMAILVGLAVSGCSGGKSLSPDRLFGAASSQTAAESAKDAAARSELALARLSERRGQSEQAERLYQRLMDQDPENPAPYHRLAVMRAKQGRFQVANEYFDRALQLAPSDVTLLRDAGYCYYLQHRLDEAEQTLRRALELRPDDAAVSNNLAVLLGEQGQDRQCLAMFRRNGTEAQTLANMAFIYAQRGELERAKEHYGRALSLDRDLKPAAEALVKIAQIEQHIEPSPTVKPRPPADSRLADVPTSRPEVGRKTARPQIPQTVGPPVASSPEDAGWGSATVSDRAQPASFEHLGPVAGRQAPLPAPSPKTSSGPRVDIASGLGRLASPPGQ